MNVRSRAWSFTINNYTEKDIEFLEDYLSTCSYGIYGKEIAPSTQTRHLQCYSYTDNALSFSKMKKLFPTAHIEKSKGSPEDNQKYCRKENDYKEYGTIPKQGKRTDLDEIRNIVTTTGKMSEVVLVAKSYQSVKMAEQLLKYHEPKRTWEPVVKWYYGPTGTGKSMSAMKELNNDFYMCMDTARWFDGYDAHENVIIDDMRKDFTKFHLLLKMLGGTPYTVETKGGSRQFLAKRIIITSCYSPYEMYETREDIQQLIRRITEIKKFE